MTTAVRYYTKSGNTKKLADAIAAAIGVEAKPVDEALKDKVDILFLGSSVYAAGIDSEVKTFIQKNKDKIGMIVGFSTAALLPSTYKQVKACGEKNGVKVSEEEFHCRGSFGLMHKNHPDSTDCANAAAFAKNIIDSQKN